MTANSLNFQRELQVKSSTDNLAEIREFIRSSAEKSRFDKPAVEKIILAVDEACTNIIKHAYKYSPDGEINIKIQSTESKFTILITDEGQHFDPNLVPEPNLAEYHKQRKVGGLGMFLMKKLMDEVRYNTLNDKRNQVVLVKYL